MRLRTPLCDLLGIEVPIVQAPMAFVAGGALAKAVSEAGGLGLIGGGYGEAEWVEAQWREAGNARVGIGFITWSMAQQPGLLDAALAHAPRAVMLSFGDAAPFVTPIKDAGAALIVQVQTVAMAREAAELGADVIVAQGTEAGGHGAQRATLPLVPAVVDAVAPVPVVAAGGIADGRTLAAALMLGAQGALVGTRFYAAEETLAHPAAKSILVASDGDDTVRNRVVDLIRAKAWPAPFDIRTLRNPFLDRWHGRESELAETIGDAMAEYRDAAAKGDFTTAVVIAGEAAGLVREVQPAAAILAEMAADATDLLLGAPERYLTVE